MSLIIPFENSAQTALPAGFDSPFCNSPATLAKLAAEEMQAYLAALSRDGVYFDTAREGKMFGVLLALDGVGQRVYLRAFAGQLQGRWHVDGFVPPLFDAAARTDWEQPALAKLAQMQQQLSDAEQAADYLRCSLESEQLNSRLQQQTAELQVQLVCRKAARRVARETADEPALASLLAEGEADARLRSQDKRQRKALCAEAAARLSGFEAPIAQLRSACEHSQASIQQRVHASYTVKNARGESRPLASLYEGKRLPAGSGDCAAPKLLAYAYRRGLKPVALAEFWWGAAPAQGIRHHGHYYPACRGRCAPLLAFMLQGLPVGRQPAHLAPCGDPAAPAVIFEDAHLIVVNKPGDLLSVPGLTMLDSVQSRMQARHPELPELQLVHRLDQSTSGLLLLAKTRRDHKALQRQFSKRTIRKQYLALLRGELQGESGEVDFPLRVDLDDRPRQLLCEQYGKAALTRWQVIAREPGRTRVALFPVTGRTHQLRVHMAHPAGVGLPIVGDELYGAPGTRLHLHAHQLSFIHPGTGELVSFEAPAPF